PRPAFRDERTRLARPPAATTARCGARRGVLRRPRRARAATRGAGVVPGRRVALDRGVPVAAHRAGRAVRRPRARPGRPRGGAPRARAPPGGRPHATPLLPRARSRAVREVAGGRVSRPADGRTLLAVAARGARGGP